MIATAAPLPDLAPLDSNELDYGHALLNILEDSASEQARLRDTQRAMLNILEDSWSEKEPFHDS